MHRPVAAGDPPAGGAGVGRRPHSPLEGRSGMEGGERQTTYDSV